MYCTCNCQMTTNLLNKASESTTFNFTSSEVQNVSSEEFVKISDSNGEVSVQTYTEPIGEDAEEITTTCNSKGSNAVDINEDTKELTDTTEDLLPPPPEKPLDSDCCGTGCVPCVLDIYDQEVKLWEQECLRIKHGIKGDNLTINQNEDILSQLEYRKFKIESVVQETHDSWRYHFTLPWNRTLGLKLGQHVIIRCSHQGEVVTRQYTPVSDVTACGSFTLLIKIYDNGKMSKCINLWMEGTLVDIRGPCGNFTYKPNQYKRIIMLAAGTGIAPMAQIIQGILNNEEDDTQIKLLNCCHLYSDVLMKKELDEWSHFWNFSVLYILSQEPIENKTYKYGDQIHKGRLDLSLLATVVNNPQLQPTQILICGTKSFNKDMIKYCKLLNIPDHLVVKF